VDEHWSKTKCRFGSHGVCAHRGFGAGLGRTGWKDALLDWVLGALSVRTLSFTGDRLCC